MPTLTRAFLIFLLLALFLAGCQTTSSKPAQETGLLDPAGPKPVALVNGTLIDGTGADPIPGAAVLTQSGRIIAAGSNDTVEIPANALVIDLEGAFILPGFINAHVHKGFDPNNLKAWALAGVTTVRDEGILHGSQLEALLRLRETRLNRPEYARVISAGVMITAPKGYGGLYVDSVDEARREVQRELDAGADLIKISLEDGYAGRHGMPKLSEEEIAAIIALAHERGTRVSAHITQSYYLEQMVAAGVDDIAHTPYDLMSDQVIAQMVDKNIQLNTTFSVLNSYNALGSSVGNLRRFAAAGGEVVLGNDYSGGPKSEYFELGMPMYEIRKMQEAGMTPMQIILASTRNAARACNKLSEIGTIEPGKSADLLVVAGDPLADLETLLDVVLVMHQGEIIVVND